MAERLSLEQLEEKAAAFIQTLRPKKEATVVTLAGDLGAGKTTFARAAARALGIKRSVTSPTFVLMKRYDLVRQPFRHLVHIDAYRIQDVEELEALQWKRLLRNPRNLIVIEWPERVWAAIPRHAHRVSLSAIAPESRAVTIE